MRKQVYRIAVLAILGLCAGADCGSNSSSNSGSLSSSDYSILEAPPYNFSNAQLESLQQKGFSKTVHDILNSPYSADQKKQLIRELLDVAKYLPSKSA